ncbi:acetylglutamate kinase [Candidatus Nitronereus thalassa]|uniref:Acetylglutamate kinase n=1 Tax=Candidatus Nitronereus thalassa TaxID=3020898 RepID=A0ABU3K9S0_9BACT|nr:acetylglutamate kinase [Candidatus Nitronereus thalassa]MDT7043112.1 acetylglutamate kinase [Candidatus Nitronereus thalassa]
MEKLIKKADVLIEALPYIRTFADKTIVIKYGGAAMTKDDLKDGFAEDVVLMKYVGLNPVIVHGGGPQINDMLSRLGIQSTFKRGVRVTDQATMDVVEMVLGGKINKEIVTLLNQHGGKAIGITGTDAGFMVCKPFSAKSWSQGMSQDSQSQADEDYGFVGEVEKIDPQMITRLQQENFIPVIAPIGVDRKGMRYNINADLVAGAVAGALKAEKLLVLTDVKGIRDAANRHVSTLSKKDVERMVKKGTISEGMLPKVRSCLIGIEAGVQKAHVIDGRVPHAILLEIFTDKGIGTEIVA